MLIFPHGVYTWADTCSLLLPPSCSSCHGCSPHTNSAPASVCSVFSFGLVSCGILWIAGICSEPVSTAQKYRILGLPCWVKGYIFDILIHISDCINMKCDKYFIFKKNCNNNKTWSSFFLKLCHTKLSTLPLIVNKWQSIVLLHFKLN